MKTTEKPFTLPAVSHGGELGWRTKTLMTQAHASSFARCVSARSGVLRAEACRAPLAKGERTHFVFVVPEDSRQTDIADWLNAQRSERAASEGEGYTFFSDDALLGGAVHCISTSGEVYQTSETRCSCPDWEFRCRKTNGRLLCKHSQSLRDRGRCVVIEQSAFPPVQSVRLSFLYRRGRGEETVRAVSEEEARADVATTDLYPWVWLGTLYGGGVVETTAALYALEKSALEVPTFGVPLLLAAAA